MKHVIYAVYGLIFSIITVAILCSLPDEPTDSPANAGIGLFIKNQSSEQGPIPVNQGDSTEIGLALYLSKYFQKVNATSSCNGVSNNIIIPDSKKSLDTVHFGIRFNTPGPCTVVVNVAMKNEHYKDLTDRLPFYVKSGQSDNGQPSTNEQPSGNQPGNPQQPQLTPSIVKAPSSVIAGSPDTFAFSVDNRNRADKLKLELVNASGLDPAVFSVVKSGPDSVLVAVAASASGATIPTKICVKTSNSVRSDTTCYPVSFIDKNVALWSQTTATLNATEGKPVTLDLRPIFVKPQSGIAVFSTDIGVMGPDTVWQWTPAWGNKAATASATITANKDNTSQGLKVTITISDGDSTKPSIKLFNEALNGKKVSAPQITVDCIVKDDASGIGTVTMTTKGGQPVNASLQKDSIYSATISGLVSGQATEITVTATDKSRRKNSATFVFPVTYDPTMKDEEPPTMVQNSGPESGSRVSAASGSLVFTITDQSKIDSVWWALNTVPVGKVAAQGDNKYTIPYTFKTFGINTITIYAQDASANHKLATKEITLTYNTKPSDITATAPANNAVDVDTLPTFTWNGGNDSDGDPVAFKVMYGQAANSLSSPTEEVKENKITLTAANKLSLATTYFWQVIGISSSKTASDTIKSQVLSFKTIMGVKPEIASQPKPTVSANEGEALKMSVEAKGNPPPTYQWYKDDSPVPGQTSAEFNKGSVTKDDAGTYYVKITNGIGEPTLSAKAVVTVHLKPVISDDPTAVTVKEGESATFSIRATGEGTLSYQWLSNGQPINQANTATYTLKQAVVTDDQKKFSCIVGNQVGKDTSNTASLTVTPLPLYTVTFDMDGGSPSVPSQNIKEGGKATQPIANPTKTGCQFDSWVSANSSTPFNFNTTIITSNITIKAKWIQMYTLTYNNNYATGNAPASQTVKAGSTVTVAYPPSTMTKTGNSFNGWCMDFSGSGTHYKGGEQITINSDITLYAQWQIVQYTVTFNANNNTTSQTFTIDAGSSLGSKFPSDPIKSGNTFKGWFTSSGSPFDRSTQVSGNVIVTAKWEQSNFTIVLNCSGGGSMNSINVPAGTSVTLPHQLCDTRCSVFNGWSTNSSASKGNYSDQATITPTSDMTLYAIMRIPTYTIVFHSGTAPSGTNITGNTSAMSNVKCGSTVSLSKNGFSASDNSPFTGWLGPFGAFWKNQENYIVGPTDDENNDGTIDFTAQWGAPAQ
jgi:uncharacterized repeat protein (TIGR02543 family)